MRYASKWLQWSSAELFFIFSVISGVMFGVFSGPIAKSMHLSDTTLGWLSGIFFIVYAITQFFSGQLFVIFSARNVLLISTLVSAAGALLFSMTNSIFMLFVARVMLGVGLAATFVGVLFVAQNSFEARSFPVISSLSQSLANLCAGIFGFIAFMLIKGGFRIPYIALSIVFVICALLVLLFFDKNQSNNKSGNKEASFIASLKEILKNSQVWYASLYFSGLFGAVLTFVDLFDVSFQMNAFHESFSNATILNSMIPFGLTIGGLILGALAQRLNNYVIPARFAGLLAIITFAVILFVRFDSASANLIVGSTCVLFGIGCSGSILAFQCVQKNIAEAELRPLATSFVLTFSYIFSGLIEQPVVGDFIANTELGVINPGKKMFVYHWIFSSTVHDGWYKYNMGLYFVFATLIISFIASCFFKQKN